MAADRVCDAQMGHNDLGEFYYQLGDLPAALKSFAQARDYCTTDKHIIEMCLNVSKVSLSRDGYLRHLLLVTNVLCDVRICVPDWSSHA